MSNNISDTNHRFADVAGEPCTLLAPISGYNRYPIVSLEEATKPLVNIVHNISTYVHVVKKRATDPLDGLSVDESAAIALYTMEWEPYIESVYYILNTALRTEERQNLKPWFSYLKLLCTALFRLPSVKLTVYRGINLVSDNDYKKYLGVKDLVWWGFSSCSTNRGISENEQFCGQTGNRILFVIDCIKGKDIGKHSYFKKESEVLLLPATTVEFVKYEKPKHGLHVIHLREIKSPHVLLEPPFTPDEMPNLITTSIPHKNESMPSKNGLSLLKTASLLFKNGSLPRGSVPETDRYRNRKLEEHIIQIEPRTEVCLIGKRYTEDDMDIIVEQIITGKSCRALFLRESGVTSHGANIIANALYNNTTLERLFISHNKIGDEGAKVLANVLADDNNVTLKQLCLSYNGITDVGIDYLAAMLESNKTLTHLWLASNNITDQGFQRLAEVLTNKNRKLQLLSLEWNKTCSDTTGNIFIEMLTKNQSLTSLNLASCKLSRKALKQLKTVAHTKKNFELITD